MRCAVLKKLPSVFPLLLTGAAFCFLCLFSGAAAEGAGAGLLVCARVIIPSLFPFFVLAGVLTKLGLPEYLGRLCAPVMSRLFGVSGAGASAFIIGVSGGYPLGAANIAELYRRGLVSRLDAERLLAFCNNSGPAFLIGAAGVGVFKSAGCGFLLYFCHVAAAVTVGVLMRKKGPPAGCDRAVSSSVRSFPEALAQSVSAAALAQVNICGFVVFFSAVVSVLSAGGVFSALAGRLSAGLGLELRFSRALLTGVLELGGAIGAMEGLPPRPLNLALAAFITGWGGLSVHCQSMSVLAGTDIKTARHFAGRLLCGTISAVYACIAALIMAI